MELESGARHYNPMGTVHRGILCDIADAAMGMALASTFDADKLHYSRTEDQLSSSYLGDYVLPKAPVISRVKTVALVACGVTDASGRLMARAPSTCLVLSGKMAEGR